jgi:acetylornithine deacetylase/succinyl-diaminopimelate desuccinylase-like protein
MEASARRTAIAELMPRAKKDLARLVAYRSVANTDVTPIEECIKAAEDVAAAFTELGIQNVKLLEMPFGHSAVYGHSPAPEGAPTVLLYTHYDVQPPLEEMGAWLSPPFELTDRDGRWFGRGSSDCKGNIVAYLTALRTFNGKFPIGIKLIIEGSEEQGLGELEGYVEKNPDLFQADVIVIADTGNFKDGLPTFTTTLRGMVAVNVNVRTLEGPVHSGMFGGPTPDALLALVQMLATLHDKNGNVTINNLDNGRLWSGVQYSNEQFRKDARVLDGVGLIGDYDVSSMIWSRVSVTILGIDCPRVEGSASVVQAEASARISMRVPPGMDTKEAEDALIAHLKSAAPWNVQLSFEPGDAGMPFQADTTGPAYTAMKDAMREAYGCETTTAGQGGSIGLANTLREACPNAEIMLVGVEEPACLIHAPNESVDPKELERHALSQALFFEKFAEVWKMAAQQKQSVVKAI